MRKSRAFSPNAANPKFATFRSFHSASSELGLISSGETPVMNRYTSQIRNYKSTFFISYSGMLGFSCKVVTLTVARSISRCCSTVASAVSDSKKVDERSVSDSALTVSYLVDSCGFKQKAATVASKKVSIKSTVKADKVLSLLRAYGFKNSDLLGILQKHPGLIAANWKISVKPKLDMLASVCPSQDLLVKLLIRCPEILRISLKKTLVPSLELLKSILGSDETVWKTVHRCPRLLYYRLSCLLVPNFSLLREVGVPEDLILALLKDRPSTMLSSPTRLKVCINRARDVGFDPKRHGFILALNAFAAVSDATWKQKVEFFKKWGWSDDEVIYAFKRSPQCMLTSEKKCDAVMKYLVNTMKVNPSFLVKNSNLFSYNLETRIISRCSIIQYLLSKGVLAMKQFSLRQALCTSEKDFFRRFVFKYEKILPELPELYTQYKNGADYGISQSV